MFKKIEALSSDNHQDLRLTQSNSFDFATDILNAPLSISEFPHAVHYYSIVFPMEGASPLVLFALNQKKNCYIDTDGTWKANYIPAHIRRYPFILAATDTQDSDDKFIVCIDSQAPHFAAGQGDPLFTADGTTAEVTQNAVNFLQKFQEELAATQQLCQELEIHKVLLEKKVSIEKNGQVVSIGGFRCVDMEKLNALEDAVLAKWVRNGLMGLINSHLISLGNLKVLS